MNYLHDYIPTTGIRDIFLISLRGIENKTKMQYNKTYSTSALRFAHRFIVLKLIWQMGIDWYGARPIAVDVKLIPPNFSHRELLFSTRTRRGIALSHTTLLHVSHLVTRKKKNSDRYIKWLIKIDWSLAESFAVRSLLFPKQLPYIEKKKIVNWTKLFNQITILLIEHILTF